MDQRAMDQSPIDRKLALGILLGASSLTIMAATAVVPSLPQMLDHYAQNPSRALLVPLVITLPGLAVAVTAPFAGLLADKWDRAHLLVAGLVLYVIAGASGLVLQSLEAIVAWRALLGCAVACIMTCTTALIVDYWDGTARKRALGMQAAAMGVGGVVFPLLGGVLAELGWRIPFAAYLLPLPLAVLAYAHLRSPPRPAVAASTPASRFPLGFGLLIYALALFGMVVLYTIPLRMPFYLRELGQPAPVFAALSIALPSFVAALAALQAPALQARMSPASVLAVAFGAMALGMSIIVSTGSVSGLFAGLATCGLGFGLTTPTLSAWLQARMPADMRGRAAGGYTMAHFLGQFLATFVFAYLAGVTSFAGTFSIVALACVAVAVFCLAMAPGLKAISAATLLRPQRWTLPRRRSPVQ